MIVDALKNKLVVIDRKCEETARTEIDELYAEARYEAGRFHVPDFSRVTRVWLELIDRKEAEFNTEIERVLQRSGDSNMDTPRIVADVDRYFDEKHFINRFDVFVDGIVRQASRYGVKYDPNIYRTDLADAAYRAAVKNRLQAARDSVKSEVQLYVPDRASEKKGWKAKLLSANESIELKPNFFGLGINLNRFISQVVDKLGKRR
ncbi:hypothetical protein MNBD_GAMMA13-215 [hydrothermal vent metagenome]|uniref:Uncharacterized protein n=1 Tax=hydrothermal vent metagenome TaxID=652676 RepID=A0A3B0YNM6_9ZZZZ